jgi:endonuclease YncB( thermonuclease family)
MRRAFVLLSPVAILAATLPASSREVHQTLQEPPRHVLTAAHPFVTDGDTLKFGPHLRVRLYGIDAPELRQSCDDGAWPAGRIAREELVRIIGSQPVTCTQVDWDSRWGRPVSRCIAGDTDVSKAMVKAGMAWAFVRYSTAFVGQQREAAAHRLGVHGHNCTVAWEWRAQMRSH